MDIDTVPNLVAEPPSAASVRRFWLAWLVFLLAVLAIFIVLILIASIEADPARVSPAG
ncbi:MAG: hypothetical protein U0075_03360 [Thermomicrobiales bacterium]